MPCFSKLSRSKSIKDVSITSLSTFDFLTPAVSQTRSRIQSTSHNVVANRRHLADVPNVTLEQAFFNALLQVSSCTGHRPSFKAKHIFPSSLDCRNNGSAEQQVQNVGHGDVTQYGTRARSSGEDVGSHRVLVKTGAQRNSILAGDSGRHDNKGRFCHILRSHDTGYFHNLQQNSSPNGIGGMIPHMCVDKEQKEPQGLPRPKSESVLTRHYQSSSRNAYHRSSEPHTRQELLSLKSNLHMLSSCKKYGYRIRFVKGLRWCRKYHSRSLDFESKQKRFAQTSNLPNDFFDDVSSLTKLVSSNAKLQGRSKNTTMKFGEGYTEDQKSRGSDRGISKQEASNPELPGLNEQMKLVKTLRELEERLQRTRQELEKSISRTNASIQTQTATTAPASDIHSPVLLTKEDYKNLVDLYYYSYNSRFSPESTDLSPTPLLLDDYSFALSSDFSPGVIRDHVVNEDESFESPLRKIEEQLKRRQLREIAVMQVFVDLLIDEKSSNRALYEAYKELPDPGVAHLPLGVIRLFMQRMSTPWTLSEKSMLRYLSLVDDMQKASLAITPAEWSCAIYLAGRAFKTITNRDVNSAFNIWKAMETEAGVQADHVTFNILFDIAVRSGKFALGETVLKEMHSRNLRLNRLGRVSLMYYHGLRKDGDGVRKAYRDFVECGEIVDTLVLNCVIASLFNAQEPQAAEQIYARMKDMQSRLVKGLDRYGEETLYKRYPGPGGCTIDQEMASNHLGRVLTTASRLRRWSVEHHESLQARMPLTPNHITFRSMISYHTTVSGDLDRLTVLLQEMTDLFHLPLQTITFHLLFKGFTIHGPKGGPHSNWSVKRLDACWKVCLEAIKESEDVKISLASAYAREGSSRNLAEEDDQPPSELTLPSITQINAVQQRTEFLKPETLVSQAPPRKLSGWAEFVLDLAGFSRDRQERLEHFHASLADSQNAGERHKRQDVSTFRSTYFQSDTHTTPEHLRDAEEGEYVLPSPSEAAFRKAGQRFGSSNHTSSALTEQESQAADDGGGNGSPHQVAATRLLMCWVIRAYARNTKSRRKVEEVWGQIRKVYKPRDPAAYEGIIRVLRRCLRDCDREGGVPGGSRGSGG